MDVAVHESHIHTRRAGTLDRKSDGQSKVGRTAWAATGRTSPHHQLRRRRLQSRGQRRHLQIDGLRRGHERDTDGALPLGTRSRAHARRPPGRRASDLDQRAPRPLVSRTSHGGIGLSFLSMRGMSAPSAPYLRTRRLDYRSLSELKPFLILRRSCPTCRWPTPCRRFHLAMAARP